MLIEGSFQGVFSATFDKSPSSRLLAKCCFKLATAVPTRHPESTWRLVGWLLLASLSASQESPNPARQSSLAVHPLRYLTPGGTYYSVVDHPTGTAAMWESRSALFVSMDFDSTGEVSPEGERSYMRLSLTLAAGVLSFVRMIDVPEDAVPQNKLVQLSPETRVQELLEGA